MMLRQWLDRLERLFTPSPLPVGGDRPQCWSAEPQGEREREEAPDVPVDDVAKTEGEKRDPPSRLERTCQPKIGGGGEGSPDESSSGVRPGHRSSSSRSDSRRR